MTVFDRSTKIKRVVRDPGTDHELPSSGALSCGAITTPAALVGTMGADCELVHGDRWQQIVGSMTENFTINANTKIGGNQTRLVIGNITTTVIGGETSLNVGPSNLTLLSPQTETRRTRHHTEYRSDHWTVTNGDAKAIVTGDDKKIINGTHSRHCGDKEKIVYSLETVVVGMNLSLLMTHVGATVFTIHLNGLQGDLFSFKTHLGAMDIGVKTKLNASGSINALTPFG